LISALTRLGPENNEMIISKNIGITSLFNLLLLFHQADPF